MTAAACLTRSVAAAPRLHAQVRLAGVRLAQGVIWAAAMGDGASRGEAPARIAGDAQDAALLARVAARDRVAFRALFDRYHGPVHGFALRMTGRADRAEEVAADTMMAVWTGAAGFAGRSRVSTWIFGIAHRTALKALRRKGVERGRVDLDEAAALADAAQPGADALVERKAVAAALAALPDDLRAALVLTYYHGHSVAEVARIAGIAEGTVKSRMHKARALLRERLA